MRICKITPNPRTSLPPPPASETGVERGRGGEGGGGKILRLLLSIVSVIVYSAYSTLNFNVNKIRVYNILCSSNMNVHVIPNCIIYWYKSSEGSGPKNWIKELLICLVLQKKVIQAREENGDLMLNRSESILFLLR